MYASQATVVVISKAVARSTAFPKSRVLIEYVFVAHVGGTFSTKVGRAAILLTDSGDVVGGHLLCGLLWGTGFRVRARPAR